MKASEVARVTRCRLSWCTRIANICSEKPADGCTCAPRVRYPSKKRYTTGQLLFVIWRVPVKLLLSLSLYHLKPSGLCASRGEQSLRRETSSMLRNRYKNFSFLFRACNAVPASLCETEAMRWISPCRDLINRLHIRKYPCAILFPLNTFETGLSWQDYPQWAGFSMLIAVIIRISINCPETTAI